MQQKDMPALRLVTWMWTMAEVIQAIGEVPNEVYRSPVWHDMARCGPEVVRPRHSAVRGWRSYPQGP